MLFIHVPMFGTAHIDSKPIICPHCKGKENDWNWTLGPAVSPIQAMTGIVCNKCGMKSWINWPINEPDHISTWLNGEYCPHRLCKLKYEELKKEMGW